MNLRSENAPFGPSVRGGGWTPATNERELIDYKTSMITDEDPLRGLLFYYKGRLARCAHPWKRGTALLRVKGLQTGCKGLGARVSGFVGAREGVRGNSCSPGSRYRMLIHGALASHQPSRSDQPIDFQRQE